MEKIREDLYQIIRLPFLKFSNKEYYSLTSITYILTVGVMFLINAVVPFQDLLYMVEWHWEILNTCAGIIEPLITYVIPGIYYYKMSV